MVVRENEGILLVEDNVELAFDLKASMEKGFGRRVFLAATAERALQLLETKVINFSILDFWIRGGTSEPIVAYLNAHNVPYFITSGLQDEAIPDALRSKVRLKKPFDYDALSLAIKETLERHSGLNK